jgi:hypothetical protein
VNGSPAQEKLSRVQNRPAPLLKNRYSTLSPQRSVSKETNSDNSGECEFSSRAADRKTSKMNHPSSQSLLEAIRLLLQKVEGTPYPTQDPISIENIKTYLRCRIAALEVEEGLRPPPPEAIERSASPNTYDWQQTPGRQPRSPADLQ